MLALSRNIAPAYQSLIEGKWDRNKYMGTQVADKTLGIVGLGRIGLAVAARAKALDMHVLGYDPFLSADRAQELGIEPVATVDDMLPEIDYLTVHTPLTDETRSLIGLPQLRELRKGVRLINCARGGIYDEAALVTGLKERPDRRRGPRRIRQRTLHQQPAATACRASSARRTWAPAPRKPRRRSRWKGSACCSTFSRPARFATR